MLLTKELVLELGLIHLSAALLLTLLQLGFQFGDSVTKQTSKMPNILLGKVNVDLQITRGFAVGQTVARLRSCFVVSTLLLAFSRDLTVLPAHPAYIS